MKHGGPAFPQVANPDPSGPIGEVFVEGLTIRDFFAAAALSGLKANPRTDTLGMLETAEEAYTQADAMIAERDKERRP